MLRSFFQVFVGQDESQDNLPSAPITPVVAAVHHTTTTTAIAVKKTTEEEEIDVVNTTSTTATDMESGTNSARKKRPEMVSVAADLSPGGGAAAKKPAVPIVTQPLRIFVNEEDQPLRFLVPETMKFAEVLKNLVQKHGGELVTEAAEDVIVLSDFPVSGQVTYSADFIYRSVVENEQIFLNSFLHSENSKKRPRPSSFTPEKDELLFTSALKHLDDGHYDPGENLFKLLVEKQILDHPWEELQARYFELMEEPLYKKKRFDFTTELDSVRSPRKSVTPPKKPEATATSSSNLTRALAQDDTEAYKTLDQHGGDYDNDSFRDGSDYVDTEEESVKGEQHHQPQFDDSLDSSIQGSIHEDSDQDADELSLEQVEQAVKKLEKLSKKPRDTVLHAIYVCNGEVKAAQDYLLRGPKAVAGKTWTKEEDRVLLGKNTDAIKRIEGKRGKRAVESRVTFLLECS